jgi:hypothetical protein
LLSASVSTSPLFDRPGRYRIRSEQRVARLHPSRRAHYGDQSAAGARVGILFTAASSVLLSLAV